MRPTFLKSRNFNHLNDLDKLTIFFIWMHGEPQLEKFMEELKYFLPNLRFTSELHLKILMSVLTMILQLQIYTLKIKIIINTFFEVLHIQIT